MYPIISEFCVISQIWEATTAEQKFMKIDLHCQQQNCSPVDVLFRDAYVTLSFPLLGSTVRMQWQKWLFLTSIAYTCKYLANGKKYSHGYYWLSLGNHMLDLL